MISELNGWPGRSSVNASPILSFESVHDSKPNWFAIPSLVRNFHLLLSSGFRRVPWHFIEFPGGTCRSAFWMCGRQCGE